METLTRKDLMVNYRDEFFVVGRTKRWFVAWWFYEL